MIRRVSLPTLPLILFTILCLAAAPGEGEADEIVVEVKRPPGSGAEVGEYMNIEGTANLPAGHHLWVFVRRVDFEPFWWPQNQGKVDPTSGEWRVQAIFGLPRDIGWEFDVAVAVFEESAHHTLLEYRREAMLTEHWRPIEMPAPAAPPEIFQVRKVSHDIAAPATSSAAEPPATAPPDAVQARGVTAGETDDLVVNVTQPEHSGVEVGASLLVAGTARLPVGHHLWVFARRVNFKPLWWPQNEGLVDPQTGEWKVEVGVGEARDVGWQFDLAVAVFEETAHIRLESYLREAMATGNWRPIQMPQAAAPPHLLRVRKVKHF